MGSNRIDCCCLVPFVCLALLVSVSSATFISDEIFGSSVSGESQRRLLQARKQCPVSFEFQNYTIVTSQCKGPEYSVKLCCEALKEFACPFADELNDLTNDCASSMFSYINIHGRYPPGLFAYECREGVQGLACPIPPPGVTRTGRSTTSDGLTHKKICDLWHVVVLVLVALLSMCFM